jgi:hypothetical protein
MKTITTVLLLLSIMCHAQTDTTLNGLIKRSNYPYGSTAQHTPGKSYTLHVNGDNIRVSGDDILTVYNAISLNLCRKEYAAGQHYPTTWITSDKIIADIERMRTTWSEFIITITTLPNTHKHTNTRGASCGHQYNGDIVKITSVRSIGTPNK